MRFRLILSFILVASLSIVTVVLVARQGAANEVRAFMYRGGNTGTTDLVENLESYYRAQGTWEGVENLLQQPRRGQGLGRGRNNENPSQRYILADAQGVIQMNTIDPDATGSISLLDRQTAIQLQISGDTVGYLLVEGNPGFDREQGSQLINRLNSAAVVAALVAGALSLVLAWFLAWRLMRPVKELSQAAEQLGKGDLSGRVKVHGSDELAVLGRSFNQMADSLQKAEQSRRAMTADIAHELRNPLAVQRANLEALQDGIYPLTEENLAPVIEQNELLTRMVEDLRTLALADSGHLELDLTAVNLMDLTARILERYQPNARSKGISLILVKTDSKATQTVQVIADPIRLEQIIGNLIQNALRYTPVDGNIRLKLIDSGDWIQLTVHNEGPAIPIDVLPYIFERFYRGDPSRSRQDGGSGLGLAISRQLAQAQGGDLIADNHADGGVVFTLRLPKSTNTSIKTDLNRNS